jgi:hypothetical protein
METYVRPKVINSKTEAIKLECGTLHLTLGYLDEVDDVYGRVTEVRAVIGKSGVCGNILLDSYSKALSMLLQSPMPRYKIVEKIKKQFKGVVCSQGLSCCVNEIAIRLLKELE